MKEIQPDLHLPANTEPRTPQRIFISPFASSSRKPDRTSRTVSSSPPPASSPSPRPERRTPDPATKDAVTPDPTTLISREDPVSEDIVTPVPRTTVTRDGGNASDSQRGDVENAHIQATVITNDALKSVFSKDEDLYSLGTTLLELLHTIQKKTDLKHRLYLLIESDRGLAGSVSEGHPEVMHRVQTRLAFSPTLCASDPQQQPGLSRLYSELTNLSFQKAPSGSSYISNFNSNSRASTVREGVLVRESGISPRVDSNPFRGRDVQWPGYIISKFQLQFPKWCPFTPKEGANEYNDPPQNSRDNHLLLNPEAVEMFRPLKDFQVLWVYQELFLFMHRQGRFLERTGKVAGMAKSITYSQFTLPWIRLNLTVKHASTAHNNSVIEAYAETVTLKKAGMTDLRKERNTQGHRRLMFILAAFYCHEERAVKPLLDYLLSIIPSAPSQLRKKSKRSRRGSRNETANSSSEVQTSHTGEGERTRKRPKTAASPRKSNDIGENRENRVREIQEDQRDRPRPESSLQPTNDQSGPPRTAGSERLTPNSNATQVNAARPESGRLECWYSRTSTTAQPKGCQTRESVFNDYLERNQDVQTDSEPEEESSVKVGKPDSAIIETKQGDDANTSDKNNRVPQLSKDPEEPTTPFEDDDFQIEGGEEENDDDLETDVFSGPIKCGALGQCRFFIITEMQAAKFLTSKCAICAVAMHPQCHVFRGKECNVCAKKKTFDDIYDKEKKSWS